MEHRNINICHLTSVHPLFDIRIFYKECVSLRRAGYNVTIIASGTNNEVIEGIKTVSVKLPKMRLLRILFAPIKLATSALRQKCFIYHFHDPELLFCGIILKIAGKRVIFDIHENVRLSLQSKDGMPRRVAGVLGGLYFIFERIAILFFDRLVLAEESYRQYYPIKKTVVVLNYPLSSKKEVKVKQFEFPIKLVYAGVVHPLRGIWEMLYITKILVDSNLKVFLTLVGELRPETLKAELDAFIVENNLEETVQILGKVDYTEVAEYLDNSHIGLSLLKPIPNYVESLPTKIFEYMQHGLPVVTNNFRLYEKHVAQTNTGICVDINNPEACADALKQLLREPRLMEDMSKNGIALTKEQFNWTSQERKLINMYSTLEY